MVRATAIADYTQMEQIRYVVDRDGVRIADLSTEQADKLRTDRSVDERVRGVLSDLLDGVRER